MKHKKKKKKGFYRIVAEAIVAGAPFDVSENGGGWKKITELVTLYMLRDLADADRYGIWNEYLARVEGVFDIAIRYINNNPDDLPQFREKHVYKDLPVGKRNNQFLSIQKDYREAEERNIDRLVNRIKTVSRPAFAEIRETQPQRLNESQQRIIKLLTGGF